MKRPVKITFGEMRAMRVFGVLIYCTDCNHSTVADASRWSDQARLSDIEPQLVCKACGSRGAEVRPDFSPTQKQVKF